LVAITCDSVQGIHDVMMAVAASRSGSNIDVKDPSHSGSGLSVSGSSTMLTGADSEFSTKGKRHRGQKENSHAAIAALARTASANENTSNAVGSDEHAADKKHSKDFNESDGRHHDNNRSTSANENTSNAVGSNEHAADKKHSKDLNESDGRHHGNKSPDQDAHSQGSLGSKDSTSSSQEKNHDKKPVDPDEVSI